jgi:hypothetical protein
VYSPLRASRAAMASAMPRIALDGCSCWAPFPALTDLGTPDKSAYPGQARSVCMVVEKAGSRDFPWDWFSEYGALVTSTNGYSSQTLVDQIRRWQLRDRRPMVVLGP